MRKSIATVSVSGALPEKLAAVAEAGFDGVEIFENDLVACPLRPVEVRRLAEDLGVGIDLYQPFRDLDSASPQRFRANLRRLEHKLVLMGHLGARTLLVCSNASTDAVTDDARLAAQLREAADRAAEHGVMLAYEALAWGRHVHDFAHAWRVVEQADHDSLGTCLDSFHILSRGSDPRAIRDIPGHKIAFVQLADAQPMAMDVLQWSRHHRCFPGQGVFDVAGLVRDLLATGYDGPLSLEVFNDAFRRSDNRRTARDALRSLIALEDDVHRGLAADHTGRPDRVRLSPPPAAPAPTGFAFAEVAAAPGGELDALLVALGFAHTGRHRSKPVHLWEQGHARILVNGADGGPCPAVAAIGLESPDPMRAVERAEGLLSPVLPRQRGADEVRLDAVAAPDGTALFFCRTGHADHADWRQDFLPVAPTTTAAAGDGGAGHAGRVGRGDGIAHIDHVALTQPPHRFDEAALFYRSVLCLRPHDSVELADPYGLLRSRAVSGPGDGVRIALNVADVDHDRHDPADASQHVALASDDIVATARRLRARRAPLLEVPDNYYDDLEARHDLAAGLVATLRELGLLYDRDEHGEFLHLYTQTVGQVFFEIVQRVDHYAGYGAHNAPVRLTAQHAARAA